MTGSRTTDHGPRTPIFGSVPLILRQRQAARAALLACAVCLLSACQVAGLVAYQVAGNQTIKPQYTPPKTPLLVVVENYANPAMCTYESEQLAQIIGADLTKHDVAPLLSQDKLRDVRDQAGDAVRKMSLSELGQKSGASQILYVNIKDCQWESLPGTNMVKGDMTVLVKLIDVQSGQTKWPDMVSDGKPMSVSAPYAQQGSGPDGTLMQQKLCLQLGHQIARQFYPYKVDNADE